MLSIWCRDCDSYRLIASETGRQAKATPILATTVLERGLVGRDNCHACLLLEEYYRLKVNDYVLAAAAAPWSPLIEPVPTSDDLCYARSLTLEAARALLKHWKTCDECRRSKVA
jgi:hypothetical protein